MNYAMGIGDLVRGALLCVALVAAGCAPSSKGGGGASSGCEEGISIGCTCDDGASGNRVCEATGYYGPCTCVSGAGGMAGAGGMVGAGGTPVPDGAGGESSPGPEIRPVAVNGLASEGCTCDLDPRRTDDPWGALGLLAMALWFRRRRDAQRGASVP